MNFAGKARGKCVTGVGHKVQLPLGPSTSDASANWDLAGCLRRRRLAFPTGKVARPLAVTDESQNAAYFLQPNWNGSIVHLTAHKQSRFQLTRLAARATLPAREGKCALRAQDAHLYKSQFPAEPTGRGAQRRLYLVPNVRNALAAGLARQIPICRNAA